MPFPILSFLLIKWTDYPRSLWGSGSHHFLSAPRGSSPEIPLLLILLSDSIINKSVSIALSSKASLLPLYSPPASVLFFASFLRRQSVGELLVLQPSLLRPLFSLNSFLLFIQEVLWCRHEQHCPRYPDHFLWEIGTNLVSKGLFWQKCLLFSLWVRGCMRKLHTEVEWRGQRQVFRRQWL